MSYSIKNKKVNFIIIGAMKCGTTATSAMLDQHTDISIHIDKEPNFFSLNNGPVKGNAKYHSGFDDSKKIWGEASTDYSKHLEDNKPIAKGIFDYNPEIKIIYIVRNPIERIVSDYIHLHARGYIKSDFSTALRSTPGLIDRSRYASQIAAFEDIFPSQSILVLDYEELKGDYIGFISTIQKFLGANIQTVNLVSKNKSIGHRKYLAQYDTLLHKTPDWIKKIIPKTIKRVALQQMKGPIHKSKPEPSISEIEYISSELFEELNTMQSRYKVLMGINSKTLNKI